MRLYVIIILCLLPFCLRAQTASTVRQGRWVSTELNSIVFRNDQVLDAIFDGTPEHTNYVFKVDTLVLVKNYYSSVDEFAFRRTDSAKFFIKKATALQLVLVPAITNARHLTRKPECRFENLKHIAAEKVRLSSLMMSYTEGDPANWQIKIDRQGNVAFSGALTPRSPAGKYTGKLNPAQMDTLQQLLQHSLLSRLKAFRQNVALTDVPNLILVVATVDGQTYRLQSQVILPSIEFLKNFILALPEKMKLSPSL